MVKISSALHRTKRGVIKRNPDSFRKENKDLILDAKYMASDDEHLILVALVKLAWNAGNPDNPEWIKIQQYGIKDAGLETRFRMIDQKVHKQWEDDGSPRGYNATEWLKKSRNYDFNQKILQMKIQNQ